MVYTLGGHLISLEIRIFFRRQGGIMSEIQVENTGRLQDWLITVSFISISAFGLILALICIYALPDRTAQPLVGCGYFIGSVIIVIALLVFRWKKYRSGLLLTGMDGTDSVPQEKAVQRNISDQILKWIATAFSLLFALWGMPVALICIYALPDKTSQPFVGAMFFVASAAPLTTCIYMVWKKR
jgi:hypothetical protein